MTHTKATLNAIRPPNCPPEKWTRKVLRVWAGLAVAAIGVGSRAWIGAEVPWWVPAASCALGFRVIATEAFDRMLSTLPKLVAAAIRDVLGAVASGKGGTP